MKKLKRLISLLLAAIMTLMMSGCSSFDISLESLMTPPRLSELQTKIYNALLSSKGDSIELAYPKSGDYRSAIVLENIDTEATQEAIVFYKSTDADEETMLRINFLDQNNGDWVSVYDIPARGTELESLTFAKIGGSSKISIIISYSLLNQNDSAVSVLNYENRTPTEIYNDTYSYLELIEPSQNGDKELLLIKRDETLGYPIAQLVGWSGDAFGVNSSVPLNSEALSFIKTSVISTGEKETAILLDYSKGDNAFATEILFCYDKILTASGFSQEVLLRRPNTLTANVSCMDIDGDGTVEIPSTVAFLGYENLTRPEQLSAVVWYSLNGTELERKYTTYCSVKLDYYVKIPSRWQGLVTVTAEGDVVSFTEYTENGETLLEVKTAEKGATVENGWRLFNHTANDKYDYYVKRAASGNTMALTDDELNDSICFFDGNAD